MRQTRGQLEGEVAALCNLSREELGTLWQRRHGNPPPKGIRHELLVRSASWNLQVKKLGGLSPNARRLLKAAMADVEAEIKSRLAGRRPDGLASSASDRLAGQLDAGVSTRSPDALAEGIDIANEAGKAQPATRRRATLSPGARLVRDWNGKTHVVDVIEEGFVFEATIHKSLTAIAHQITGAHWSGPRFFGL